MKEAWQYAAGDVPFVVTAYERGTKDGVVYLRWRVKTKSGDRNWRHVSLRKRLRDKRGGIVEGVAREAMAAAQRKHQELVADEPAPVRAAALTLAEGLSLVVRADIGKYATDTAHRRELQRSLRYVIEALGADRTWATLAPADFRKVWRQRQKELAAAGFRGCRGAEVTVSRWLSVAAWLRDEQLIGAMTCIAPRHWKQELRDDWRHTANARTDYEPARPRHTVEELRGILAVADQVDPRFALLLALGAELRLGQVARARRTDLDLERAMFLVPGVGHKKGVTEYLTAGQLAAARAALAGYLVELEAGGGDYPLFPASQLTGGRKGVPVARERHRNAKPVNGRTIVAWFAEAERLAGVPHVAGRGAYGLRRAGVDGAKGEGISREALQQAGGWSNSQMPDHIYADQEAEGPRQEARGVRARVRGEPTIKEAPPE